VVEWEGTVVLETPRLLLRTFRRDDLEPYAALNADPEVVRYLGGVPFTAAQSEQLAVWAQERYATEGLGRLAVERKADHAFLGMCGIGGVDWYPDDREIGWRLAREHWGHGYATEAALAWLHYAFTKTALARVISVADVPNLRSIAVMKRLGMSLVHETELEEDGIAFQAVVYEVTAQQWAARADATGVAR
jgi:RimJ/RimL family protein N-acetyltransferase